MIDVERRDDSPIESLNKKLNTPGHEALTNVRRSGFHEPQYDVANDFPHEHDVHPTMKHIAKHHSKVKWFFIGALLFFVCALGSAFFFLSGNRNVVSSDKIDIAVSGPVIIASGETLPLAIEIRNRNATALQVADLIIEYPEGTRSSEDVKVGMPRKRLSLGDIGSGNQIATGTSAVLFAEEGTEQAIHVTLEYRIAGSNAILVKEAEFVVRIGASPLALSLSAPTQLNAGQEATITLSIVSNSSVLLEDVVLAAEYPFGFVFKESAPSPTVSEGVWSLGDIEPEGKRTITIKGTVAAQNNEDRVFRFRAGLAAQGDDTKLGTAFAQVDHIVSILRPFIETRVLVNGQEGIANIPPGGQTRVDISWRNNLPSRITDAVVTARIEGDAVNERTVGGLKGFYNSANNTMTWDKRDSPELGVIAAGETGAVMFTFNAQTVTQGGGRIDPNITIVVSVVGNAVSESGTPQQVTAQVQRAARVSSEIVLSARAVRTVGPLETMGPLPPKVEQKSTYTIIWSIANAINDVSGATVRAVLPQYMSWENVQSPTSEDIHYDSATHEVVWRPGLIRSGVGYGTPARSVAFQVGLTPSLSQVGTPPTLIGAATLSATDDTAGISVSAQAQSLNTTLYTDPGFQGGWDNVVE